MKNRILAALFTLTLIPAAFASDAKTKNWEISGGPNVSLNMSFYEDETFTNFLVNSGLSGTVGYFVTSQLQLVLNPGFAFSTGLGASATTTIILGGANYSFSPAVRDSFFVEALLGFASLPTTSIAGGVSSTRYDVDFVYAAKVGKRFELTESVSYRPYVQWSGYQSEPSTRTLSVVPLHFSFFL